MSKFTESIKVASTLISSHKTQHTKLLNLHNKITDQDKLGEAERIFLADQLQKDPVKRLQHQEHSLDISYWEKLTSQLNFSEFAPSLFCEKFFWNNDKYPFTEQKVNEVLNLVFNQSNEQLLGTIKEILAKNWTVGFQKQGKYRFISNQLPIAHFGIADDLIFPLFKYLSNGGMDEAIDWRNKWRSEEYSDLMMAYNGLVEIKLLKRGVISIVFSKRLNALLEAELINISEAKAA